MPARPLRILAFVGSPRNEESWTYQYMRIIEEKMRASVRKGNLKPYR